MYSFFAGKDLHQFYRVIPSAIFTVDKNRVVTSVNEKAAELFGLPVEEIIGMNCTNFCFGPCCTGCTMFDDDVIKPLTGKEGIVRRHDGVTLIVSKNLDLLRDSNGIVVGGIETFEDITERKQIEEALRESEERYRTLFERTANPVLVTDTEGNYIDFNEAACRFFECSREELLKINVRDTLPVTMSKNHAGQRIAQKKEGDVEAEYFINNQIKFLELAITPAVWQGKNVIFGVGKDITERKRAEEKIWYMAYHDYLTGLPNRVLLKDHLNLAIAHARRHNNNLAVLFLDLDRFKNINDTMGHDVGDQLLKAVAERLKNCVREDDTVARQAGDEFIILLSEIDHVKDALTVSQKIIDTINLPLEIDGREFHISTSIRIALYPIDACEAKILLRNADIAMYKAKEQGGNNYQLYTKAMNKLAMDRMEMENSLRHALERKELVLYYQPQVHCKTGEIVGMEALIRWNHPVKGLVSPSDFIPLAEETGIILNIGEWVLLTACEQNKSWQDKGCDAVRISVNLSARQFRPGTLVPMVDRVLRETGLDPQYLQLEITESTAMQNLEDAIFLVNDLKDMGVHIAIDDFGTGYASLSYLKHFPPIDTLKIDRSFVKDISKGNEDAASALIATMIVLAKNLRLKVVAEGVENEEQLDFLVKQDCDVIQGFFFSKPVPAEELEYLLLQRPFIL